MSLPDDVAVRTTNHHGTAISRLLTLSHVWIELCQPRDPIATMLLDAHDDFQASLYNAITGFYRVSISASRNALELLAIGTWAQLCGKRKEFREYLRGDRTLSFGTACDGLSSGARALEAHLQSTLGAQLFNQRASTVRMGYARQVFDHASDFTHSRPGHTDSALRRSNGPIYVEEAFNHAAWIQSEVFSLSFIFILLARPRTQLPGSVVKFMRDPERTQPQILRDAFEFLKPR